MIKNNLVYILVFLAGFVICYLSIPTKETIKTEVIENEKHLHQITELQKKINTLEKNNSTLRKNIKTHTVEKPDGSRETTTIENSVQTETQEREIKENYDQTIKAYEHEINNLKSKLSETVNKKYLSVEVGLTTNKNIYSHVTYDLFNSFFIGGHFQIDPNKKIEIEVENKQGEREKKKVNQVIIVGAGVGIRL